MRFDLPCNKIALQNLFLFCNLVFVEMSVDSLMLCSVITVFERRLRKSQCGLTVQWRSISAWSECSDCQTAEKCGTVLHIRNSECELRTSATELACLGNQVLLAKRKLLHALISELFKLWTCVLVWAKLEALRSTELFIFVLYFQLVPAFALHSVCELTLLFIHHKAMDNSR